MTSHQHGQDCSDMAWIMPRCLVLVLKEVKHEKHRDQQPVPAKELFDSFQEENKECYWNPHLEESIKNVRFIGSLHPCSILISARDIYLDTIKAAWSRRVLRPPTFHNIVKVGELPSIEMLVHPQTQFTPLPEALCLIISELTRNGEPAVTLDLIQQALGERYHGMQQPSEHIIYETLDSLMKERKIYHTGHGYKIVTPETFSMLENGFSEQMSPIFLPLPVPSKTACSEMRSISCQTEVKEETPAPHESDRKSRLERSNSMRTPKRDKKEKADSFTRSNSLRYSEDKAKAIVKDINSKNTEVQEKEKVEKPSLLNKILRRHKHDKHKQTGGKTEGRSEEIEVTEEESGEKAEVEYATFSAQFPPTDWSWYDQQVQALLDQQYQTGALCPKHHAGLLQQQQQAINHIKTQTWHLSNDHANADEPEVKHRSRSLPANVTALSHRPHSASSQSHDSCSSSQEASPTHSHNPDSQAAKDGHKSRYRSSSKPRKSKKSSQKLHTHHENEHDISNHESNIYCEPESLNTSVFVDCENPPALPHRHNPLDHEYVNITAMQELRKGKKGLQKTCPTFCGNDISIEYHGRMPKKNASYSMSRDSGVNCIGLGDSQNSQGQSRHKTPSKNQVTPRTRGKGKVLDMSLQQDSGFSSPRTDTEYGPVLLNNNVSKYDSPSQTPVNNNNKLNSFHDKYKSCLSITGSQFYPPYKPSSRFAGESPAREEPGQKDAPSSSTSSQQTVLEASTSSRWQQHTEDHKQARRRRNRDSHSRDSMLINNKHNRDSMLVSSRHSNALRHSLRGAESQESRLDFLKDCKVVGIV